METRPNSKPASEPQGFKCNICGCPRLVTYKETNKEGIEEVKTHIVKCGGHTGIHPRLWNMSGYGKTSEAEAFLRVSTYEDYQVAKNLLTRRKK